MGQGPMTAAPAEASRGLWVCRGHLPWGRQALQTPHHLCDTSPLTLLQSRSLLLSCSTWMLCPRAFARLLTEIPRPLQPPACEPASQPFL